MKLKSSLFALVTSLVLLTSAESYHLEISDDYGGRMQTYLTKLYYLKKTKIPVRISGACFSACTMYLSLPNVCVGHNAIFGFHQGSTSSASYTMYRMWPELTKTVLRTHGIQKLADLPRFETDSYLTISGDNLGIPKCAF